MPGVDNDLKGNLCSDIVFMKDKEECELIDRGSGINSWDDPNKQRASSHGMTLASSLHQFMGCTLRVVVVTPRVACISSWDDPSKQLQ